MTFLLLTIGNWGAGNTNMVKAGGWVGLLTALLAWYASAAGVINETHGKGGVYPWVRSTRSRAVACH